PTMGKPPSSSKKATSMRKREHEMGSSGDSPQKKREAIEAAENHILLIGFTPAEVKKYEGLVKGNWAIVESLSDSVTHLVIKSIGALKNSMHLLPIYYAVLKDIWMLHPSFLPTSVVRKKSVGGPRPLEEEAEHVYDGKEIDANSKTIASFPSIVDIIGLRDYVIGLELNGKRPILGMRSFRKVAILAGRSKESKQRREELKMVMEAGGATVVDESVFKTWKANRKKGKDIEVPSMIVIVNGETNVPMLGLDNEAIRDLLKARSPIFYEEYIMSIFMYRMVSTLDDLLLQSFVFIHEQWKAVDPDGKLQAKVMGEEDEPVNGKTPTLGGRMPSARRTNIRASSSARESSSTEQIVNEKKKEGKKEKEEEKKEEEKVVDPPKKERGRKKEIKDEAVGDKKEEKKVVETVKKSRGRPKKGEKKEEEKEGKTAKAAKKVKSLFSESLKEKEEAKMEVDDVDPDLADGNLDLLAEFEKEIDERNGRREERSEEEMKELREMREDRGDGEEEEEEQPVTPEVISLSLDNGGGFNSERRPILFSQLATQPEIEIPEVLRKALEVKEEEEDDAEIEGYGRLVIDEKDSDDGSDTIVGEGANDVADLNSLSEGMNDEMEGGEKDDEEEGSDAPQGYEPPSDFGMKSETITVEATKECETCNHLGSQHLYFNKQKASEIVKHFSADRLEWFDLIIDVRGRMPWIKEGKVLRPSSTLTAQSMTRRTMDLFYSFYHDLKDESTTSTLLAEMNSSNAMEMFEAEWEEERARRPPLDMMIKMLHEFAVKRHAEDLLVPERACTALRTCLPVFLPSSVFGRHYWLTVLAGGSDGIKGRASQVVEEMARRCKTFFIKALLAECFLPCVTQFVTYFCEVDFLCAQTPVIEYDLPGKKKEEESQESQRTTRTKKSKKKKNPVEKFPLILLLVMELDEEPRRGLSEAAILMIQKLMENVLLQKSKQEWAHSATLQRALLCLLEAARWHCSMAASSALTGAERRRIKAAEAAGGSSQKGGEKVPVELQQNVLRVIRFMLKKGYTKLWVREALTLSWLDDILNSME
ncbi:hypothetical protein PMAYCL1PPCAC_13247, partial [Pristionchus mayeri]